MRNFSEVVADLEDPGRGERGGGEWGGGEQVADAESLGVAVSRLLSAPEARADMGERARLMAERQSGVLPAVLAALEPLLAPLRPTATAA
jgi:glycosyltransferase involved in cell wall biosynthesis